MRPNNRKKKGKKPNYKTERTVGRRKREPSPHQLNVPQATEQNFSREDELSLRKGEWLTDGIIEFGLKTLWKNRSLADRGLVFIDPCVAECLRHLNAKSLAAELKAMGIVYAKYAFIPLNGSEGSHWSLLVAALAERAILHYDSFEGTNSVEAASFADSIKQALDKDYPHLSYSEIKTLQQANNYDCGVHVLCLVDQIVEYACESRIQDAPQLNRETIIEKRTELRICIQQYRKLHKN